MPGERRRRRVSRVWDSLCRVYRGPEPRTGPSGSRLQRATCGGLGELAQGTPSRHPAPDIHAPCLVLSLAPLPPPPASLDLVGRLLGNRLPLCRVFPRPGHRALRHHRWPGVAPAAAAGQAQCRAGRGEHTATLRPPPTPPSSRALPAAPAAPRVPPTLLAREATL